MTGKLRIPEHYYEARKQRMKRLIELNAPAVIIYREAQCLVRSFERRTFREWLQDMNVQHAPHWLYWLMDREYRQFAREAKEERKPCVGCGEDTDQICENCEAPLCYACDACKYHDVLVCKDEAACSRRCEENERRGDGDVKIDG